VQLCGSAVQNKLPANDSGVMIAFSD
jgi:hypothetical protein